jgi:hypothetical protein
MRRFSVLLLGIMLGGGLVYTAFHYHVVRTADEWLLVPKRQAAFSDAYADVRQWSLNEWRRHPDLVQALLAKGRQDVMFGSSRDFLRGMYRKVGSALDEASDIRRE